VETAANLVQEAAHPDANIIFGAAFDETLEDEIRVTVIATGFDEDAGRLASEPYTEAKAKVEEQAAPTVAAPTPLVEDEPVAAPAAEVSAAAETPVVEEKPSVTDDDWDILERIFNKKR